MNQLEIFSNEIIRCTKELFYYFFVVIAGDVVVDDDVDIVVVVVVGDESIAILESAYDNDDTDHNDAEEDFSLIINSDRVKVLTIWIICWP